MTTTTEADSPDVSVGPLTPISPQARPKGPLVLIVLDGVGVGLGDQYDAVATADTPTLDWLEATGPTRTLRAHGRAVGLGSDSDMGNSEVGHNTLGAGRIFDQGANQVDKAIESGRIWEEIGVGSAMRCSPTTRRCISSGCSLTVACTPASITSLRC